MFKENYLLLVKKSQHQEFYADYMGMSKWAIFSDSHSALFSVFQKEKNSKKLGLG